MFSDLFGLPGGIRPALRRRPWVRLWGSTGASFTTAPVRIPPGTQKSSRTPEWGSLALASPAGFEPTAFRLGAKP